MNRLRAKRWIRIILAAFIVGFLGILTACWRFDVWNSNDYRTYWEVRRYSIGEDLWNGRIVAGQDAETFAARYPPQRSVQSGRYQWMKYYTPWPVEPNVIHLEGMTVLAKDGKLVHASGGGCCWGRVFFQSSDEEYDEFYQAWERHFGR